MVLIKMSWTDLIFTFWRMNTCSSAHSLYQYRIWFDVFSNPLIHCVWLWYCIEMFCVLNQWKTNSLHKQSSAKEVDGAISHVDFLALFCPTPESVSVDMQLWNREPDALSELWPGKSHEVWHQCKFMMQHPARGLYICLITKNYLNIFFSIWKIQSRQITFYF